MLFFKHYIYRGRMCAEIGHADGTIQTLCLLSTADTARRSVSSRHPAGLSLTVCQGDLEKR